MNLPCKITLLFLLLFQTPLFARDYLIYSVAEEIPMGYDNEVTKKNYYINMGSAHGITEGSILNVYRVISNSNPYDQKTRINHKVKIGEIKVLHTDEDASIGSMKNVLTDENTPLFEISNFMIGDSVSVNIDS